MTPTDEARVDEIGRINAILPVVHDALLLAAKGEGYWTGRIIAADPLTAEHAQLKADVVEVLEEGLGRAVVLNWSPAASRLSDAVSCALALLKGGVT